MERKQIVKKIIINTFYAVVGFLALFITMVGIAKLAFSNMFGSDSQSLIEIALSEFLITLSLYCLIALFLTAAVYIIYKRFAKSFLKIAVISSIVIGLLFNLYLTGSFINDFAISRYDNNKWINAPDSRHAMVYDMFEKIDIEQLDKEGILENLGKPAETFPYMRTSSMDEDQIDLYDANIMVYSMGGSGSNEYSGYFLYLKFDRSDHLIQHSIYVYTT